MMYFHHYLFDGFQNGIGCYFGMSDLSVHVHRSMRRATTIPTYPSLTLPRQVNSWHHIFFLYLSASRLLKKVTSQNCLPIGGFSFRQFGRFFVLFFAYIDFFSDIKRIQYRARILHANYSDKDVFDSQSTEVTSYLFFNWFTRHFTSIKWQFKIRTILEDFRINLKPAQSPLLMHKGTTIWPQIHILSSH